MKKKKVTRKKKLHHRIMDWSRGNITMTLLIGIVIVGAVMMVSGIFPKNEISERDPNGPHYRIDPDQAKDSSKNNLQLKTIDFQACSETVAVEMVLDRSSSMNQTQDKLPNLKNASNFFITKLTDDAPLGLVTFSTAVKEEEPIQRFGDIKTHVTAIINGLTATGLTNTHGALTTAQNALALGTQKFPGRTFTLILVTDGVPTVGNTDPNAIIGVANEIKNTGVKVYAIGITQGVGNRQKMIDLMTGIASPNSFIEAPDTTTLNQIYDKIGFEMCQKAS